MQPVTLEQGTRLDDRYQLEQRVGGGDGCTLWRAVDQVLSRRVAIRTVEESSGLADPVLQAARAASVVSDPRLARVLDASRTGGLVYVVSEWVEGVSLATQLSSGPLDPHEAAYVVGQVAEAVETAHRAGVAHLCLQPHMVRRSRSGEVRVLGLGVAAALSGVSVDDTARADTRGLGALLYAAVTARWPDGDDHGLAAAPTEDGLPLIPRRVRAGIPAALDQVVERTLYDPAGDALALASPAEVAAALARLPRPQTRFDTLALPMMPPEPAHRDGADADTQAVGSYQPDAYRTNAAYPGAGDWDAPPRAHRAEQGSRATTFARRVLIAVVVLAVLFGAWQVGLELLRTSGGTPDGGGTSGQQGGNPGPKPGTPVQVRQVSDFDPLPDGNGSENPETAGLAVDPSPATAWTTMTYYGPGLGGLKPGVGLLLDLDEAQKIGSVKVSLQGVGTDIELRGATAPGEAASDYRRLDRAQRVGESVTLKPREPTRARYLLLWLTELPQVSGDRYKAGVADIEVRR